uniref:WAP domain-containing protein n=1 Tax=Globodera pallida TaxID=36090 RepID=A0A183C367_GLOPA
MENKFLLQTNGLAKANAELESLFDKAESTTYNNIIVHLNKILTLHSMLKSDRLQYYTELFSIHKERHSNSRRIARGGTPEMCAAVNTLKNNIVCCGMPHWPDENACCINDCHEACYRV